MDIDWLQHYCLSLPAAAESIKWESNLCFTLGGKIFCMAGLIDDMQITFKVNPDVFDEISCREGFIPAAYLARAKWVTVINPYLFTKREMEELIRESYELIRKGLPKKIRMALQIP